MRCIIIGGGQCAAQLAVSLRQSGWKQEILVIGEEKFLPYHRPPLSKQYLASPGDIEGLYIKPAIMYEKLGIEFLLGTAVSEIDRTNKAVVLGSGSTYSYEKLVVATGSRARELAISGVDKSGVSYIRTKNDIESIRERAVSGQRAVIIGGGYLGLEVASILSSTVGMDVTILQVAPRILNRVTTPIVSDFFARVHREQGVDIVTGVIPKSINGDTAVCEVECENGSIYPATLVVIGIGVVPQTQLAETAGLAVDDGILVNEFAETSDADILAAGDCTSHVNALYSQRIRLESVQNATDQAKIAALTICGKRKSYDSLPTFWSDQYDLNLQIAGLSDGYDQLLVRGDSIVGRSFVACYLREGKMIAVDAINRSSDFEYCKKLISSGADVPPEMIEDETISLEA